MSLIALKNENIVPISRFNKGEASKIFTEVKNIGQKFVFKNNVLECILLSPEQYDEFMERMIHMELYIEALERLAKDSGRSYSQEEIMQEFGITREQLDSCEVEIE